MAYDTSKLVKLAALKSLAEKIKADYATQTQVDNLSTRIDDIVSTGGEPNTINTISVNGTEQTITDKNVNITVPTAVSELSNDSGYQTASDVADAVAAIVADAPEAYDTLKEISDWISTHTDSAATMNSNITTNANDIADLKALIGELPETATSTTVIAYISEMIDSIEEYTHPTYTAYAAGLYNVTVDSLGHVSAATAVTADDIAALGVAITDTTYNTATTTADGLMSASDKTKLDGVEDGANNYTHPDSGVVAGSYGDSTAQTPAFGETFRVNYETVDSQGHITAISAHNVTVPATEATTTVAGLLSASDKTKLDAMEIATDAEVSEVLTEVFGE